MIKDARISVIGAGYVGLITAACFAKLGHRVICVETDPEKLFRLKRGEVTIFEPGLTDIFKKNHGAGRLVFTDAYDVAIPSSDFTFIAVNTPAKSDGHADISFVLASVESIIQNARSGLIIVVKSTVPVGTCDAIEKLIRRAGLSEIHVVSNPEFLREGSAVEDFMQPDRILIGTTDNNIGKAVAELYGNLNSTVIMCNRRSAELAKYAANALLATRISFMNEVANVCSAVKADIHEVERALGTDKRIGPAFLKAGLGWGGSCFPKDLKAFATTARSHGFQASITEATLAANLRQRQIAADYLRLAVDGKTDTTLGVLGLAFKPNTDDIRESPALAIIEQLVKQGIRVRAHDFLAMDNARRVMPQIRYCRDPYDVASGSDGILLATEWPQYVSLDWARIRSLMRGNVILDGRNVLDINLLLSLGFKYLSFGRHIPNDGNEPTSGEFVKGARIDAA